jgi:hypothetical protein
VRRIGAYGLSARQLRAPSDGVRTVRHRNQTAGPRSATRCLRLYVLDRFLKCHQMR